MLIDADPIGLVLLNLLKDAFHAGPKQCDVVHGRGARIIELHGHDHVFDVFRLQIGRSRTCCRLAACSIPLKRS